MVTNRSSLFKIATWNDREIQTNKATAPTKKQRKGERATEELEIRIVNDHTCYQDQLFNRIKRKSPRTAPINKNKSGSISKSDFSIHRLVNPRQNKAIHRKNSALVADYWDRCTKITTYKTSFQAISAIF